MFRFTICFIKRGNEILLLNREHSSWMGMWNGVGGKLEENEDPRTCILREIKEETGITVTEVEYKGNVKWKAADNSYEGGMYAYVANLAESYEYDTPLKMDEGILDWKKTDWILHPENTGVANLKYFLPLMLHDDRTYNHCFIYDGDEVKDFQSTPFESSPIIKSY